MCEEMNERCCKCCGGVFPVEFFMTKTGKEKKRCKTCRDKINSSNYLYLEKTGKITKGSRGKFFCVVCNMDITLACQERHNNSVAHKIKEFNNKKQKEKIENKI
jgi:hypothetical protein